MKLILLNDNGNISHVGCRAVSDAHARMLGRRGHHVVQRCFLGDMRRFADPNCRTGILRALRDEALRQSISDTDGLVLNGEGTIHHGKGTEYLNILGAALELGKVAVLVNCVLEAVEGFDSVLAGLHDLTVRDLSSLAYLNSKGIKARLVQDSFLEAGFEPQPIADLTGRIVVTDWHHERDHDVGHSCLKFLGSQPLHKIWFLPFLNRDASDAWHRIPATLAKADAVVTGRHHGVYAAAMAGVPFITFGSNTHKIEGFMAGFPELAFALNPASIKDALAKAVSHRHLYLGIQERLLKCRPLSTFDALGGISDPVGESRELAQLAADCAARSDAFTLDLSYRIRRRSDEVCLSAAARCVDVPQP